ncbi:MAG: YdcF family protein [Acidobacteria bacterium]|nr:YdcF family protein [Acidobacteriota bacterium]MBV9624715.1 YdcF family protein [Acidobacteriota bacterium]
MKRWEWPFWSVLPLVIVAGSFLFLARAVVRDSHQEKIKPADAIVVFGAAEYDGRPSPVFRARLDHAYSLFHAGLAPVVITTGGAAADPNFTEGGVGHDYLMRRGVPDSALIAETQASDTAESAVRLAVIMRANGMKSCIAVSDAYHVFRIRKMLESQGLEVYLAPRPDSRPRSLWQRALAILREAASYLVWRAGIRN